MSNPTPPPIPPPDPYQRSHPEPSLAEKMVPASNMDALVGYYLGLFGLVPPFGLIISPLAIMFGRRGLARIAEEPGLPGKTHAKVGVGCGAACLVWNLLIVGFVLLIYLTSPKH